MWCGRLKNRFRQKLFTEKTALQTHHSLSVQYDRHRLDFIEILESSFGLNENPRMKKRFFFGIFEVVLLLESLSCISDLFLSRSNDISSGW